MDEQQSIFYLDQFIQNDAYSLPQLQTLNSTNSMHQPQHQEKRDQGMHVQKQKQKDMSKESTFQFKAFNPVQFAESLPLRDQQRYLSLMEHNKAYMGLTHFVNFDHAEEMPQFMNMMRGNNNKYEQWSDRPLHLQQLFDSHTQQSLNQKIQQIQKQIMSVNSKCFSQINISHVIHPNFGENLDNFRHLNSHINFIKDLQVKLINFLETMREIDTDETLIVDIYEFWMGAFRDFVISIKKHTERYTLNFLKKCKESSQSKSNNQAKSTSSSRIHQPQKRKPWKPIELQYLQKLISSNTAYNQSAINKAAEQLSRTPASITSKLQKLVKEHKVQNPDYEVHENMTLFQKIVSVLKNHSEGLTREGVIAKIGEYYEMGEDGSNWQKSVAQILSSRVEIVKIKGIYSLIGFHKIDMSKKSFKDKVVNCLLTLPEQRGDLRRIVDQYISLYGTMQGISILSEQRRKSIQTNISKSLCRYDIFNKDHSKTVYKLRQHCDERQFIDQEIENFIS